MFDGFYKCEYRAGPVLNRSVMFVRDGHMLGGNSAFAHIGSYKEIDGEITARVAGQRHADDPRVGQLYGTDNDVLNIRAHLVGDAYHLVCSPVRLPDQVMHSVMTRLDEDAMPTPGRVGPGGIANGLYALRIRTLDESTAA